MIIHFVNVYDWFPSLQDLLLWLVYTRQYVHLVPPVLGAEEGKLILFSS